MNKKLIASAMGLVMAGGMGLASADVKIYGQIDLSILATDSDAQGFQDDVNMVSTNSALGVKGEEDLGNGLNAFFQLEYEADVANGGDFGTGRDQFVGLGMEDFGKVRFGAASTAYKGPGSKIDPFYRTPLQSRDVGLQSNLHSGKGAEGQGRGTNMIRYDSPSLGGFGLVATYQLAPNKNTSNINDDTVSAGVDFKGGNLYAAVSYITTQQSNDNAAAEALVRYDIGDFSLHGIYEYDDGLITAQANNGFTVGNPPALGRNGSAQDNGADIYSLGATYTIGNNLIGADWGHRDKSNGVDGAANTGDDIQDYDVWRIAAYHSFSKRTRVYAGYANTDYNKKGEDDRFAVGIRHNF